MTDGKAGAGMVLRNADGSVIFAACFHLFHCSEALETEIRALVEGMSLAFAMDNVTGNGTI